MLLFDLHDVIDQPFGAGGEGEDGAHLGRAHEVEVGLGTVDFVELGIGNVAVSGLGGLLQMVFKEGEGLLCHLRGDIATVVFLSLAVGTEGNIPYGDEHSDQKAYGYGQVDTSDEMVDGECKHEECAYDDDGHAPLVLVNKVAVEPDEFLF